MALQENVASRLTYKIHAASSMVANTLLVPATDPAASGGQELRRVTSTLSLVKDTYQSAEVRTDRQISDFRHGVQRIQGEITGELSTATYFPFYEAAFRATKVATFSKSNADFTNCAADTPTSKFTVGGSTWAAQNFRVGDVIRFANMSNAANNATNFLIYSLSGVDAFVTPAPTTQAADAAFTVDRTGTKIFVPTTSHVKRLFAFEHFHADIDITTLFTECRITGFSIQCPATGMATTTINVLGREQTVTSGASSPFFTSPTAAGTDGITAAVNGKIVHAGLVVGVITGVEINFTMAAEATPVVGQNFVAEVFLGRTIVTGQLTALLQDSVFLDAFDAETEVEILLMMTTTSAVNAPFVTFYMPRCKLGGATVALTGEAGVVVTAPFTALLKPTTTGFDNTTCSMVDSQAV